MASDEKIVSLSHELSSTVLSHAEQYGVSRLLLAAETQREFSALNKPLPEGAKVAPHPLKGRRTAQHGPRVYSRQSIIAATWPEDGMVAARVPILIFTLRGAADLRIGDYLFHCPAQHFLLIPPDIPRFDGSRAHLAGAQRQDGYCSLLWLRPLQGGLESWICHSHGERHWSQQVNETVFSAEPQALGYFLTLLQEMQSRPPGWERTCQSLMTMLYVLIWRAAESAGGPMQLNRRIPAEHLAWDPIAFARHYARQHLKESPSLNQIARVACLSRSEFTRRFRLETGQTFNAWLTCCRIEEARRLLVDTDWSVVAVAFQVGLKPSRLRDLFREYEKMSPQEYRFQMREKRSEGKNASDK